MSKLDKFLAKKHKATIMGEEYELKPLTAKDLPLIARIQSRDNNIAMKGLMDAAYEIFKQIFPDATKIDFDNVDMQALNELTEAFFVVNGVDVKELKDKLEKLKNDVPKTKELSE